MSHYAICLLGRFSVKRNDEPVRGLEARKLQELFTYLLLHRKRPHLREALAGILWGEQSGEQSRKYFRQALWQLQTALDPPGSDGALRALQVDADWVDVNPEVEFWTDVAELERAYTPVEAIPGHELDPEAVRSLERVLPLYKGDLLEGCYLDWCLFERERLKHTFLAVLDKLMVYYDRQGKFETGLDYGTQILRIDRTAERTHRRMMRLYYLMGDRSAAIRQYQNCAAVLQEELGARPSRRTDALFHRIQSDEPGVSPAAPSAVQAVPVETTAGPSTLGEALERLNQYLTDLMDLQHRVRQEIHSVERVLRQSR
jgi:DNA-binding SARP family transcriptional activator